MQFQISYRRKKGKKIPESSRLEFLEKFSANNFALSDAEDNTSGPLNRGGIADLPLLRTLLAIHQKSWEPSFWKVMDSFVLLAYASFAASRTFLQQLLVCLNFRIRRFILLLQTKSDFYELWQQHKQLKTMMMNETWLGTSYEGYIYINSNLNTEFTKSSRRNKFKYILPWNISQVITKNVPISIRIAKIYSIKWGTLLWIWWKVNGNWDTTWSDVPNGGKVIAEQIQASEERKTSKRVGLW